MRGAEPSLLLRTMIVAAVGLFLLFCYLVANKDEYEEILRCDPS